MEQKLNLKLTNVIQPCIKSRFKVTYSVDFFDSKLYPKTFDIHELLYSVNIDYDLKKDCYRLQ